MTSRPSTPAAWFAAAIASGIQRLMVLGLEGTPAARTIDLTTVTWIDTLWPGRRWEARLDETRIQEAFRLLAVQSDRWPSPSQFLRRLPARAHPLALPAPRPSATQKEAAKTLLQTIKKKLEK